MVMSFVFRHKPALLGSVRIIVQGCYGFCPKEKRVQLFLLHCPQGQQYEAGRIHASTRGAISISNHCLLVLVVLFLLRRCSWLGARVHSTFGFEVRVCR
jgi:hypothetical protein